MIFCALAISAPTFMTQCKSVGGAYQDIEYDPATLKTPDGHGMKKEDYPFDDGGNYRKDWVKNKDQGRTRSSYDMPDPEPVVASTTAETGRVSGSLAPVSPPPSAVIQPINPIVSSPYEVASSSSEVGGDSSSAALTSAALNTSTYHRVKSGETLYSIARRYNTSISELKWVNGLTGDGIRSGQSLRLP